MNMKDQGKDLKVSFVRGRRDIVRKVYRTDKYKVLELGMNFDTHTVSVMYSLN